MYQAVRKVHLWVGLILAVILLMEAITGLILAEPWMVGQEKTHRPPADFRSNIEQGKTPGTEGSVGLPASQGNRNARGEFSVFGFVKGLHQGKVGNLDLKWVIDLSAIGLVVLTLTGIYLSLPHLLPKNRGR